MLGRTSGLLLLLLIMLNHTVMACDALVMHLPDHADVANAIGAVVGQVAIHAKGSVTSPGPGLFVAHIADGPASFNTVEAALAELEATLAETATKQALTAGVENPHLSTQQDIKQAEIEGTQMFISAEMTVTAKGRPRIAHSA